MLMARPQRIRIPLPHTPRERPVGNTALLECEEPSDDLREATFTVLARFANVAVSVDGGEVVDAFVGGGGAGGESVEEGDEVAGGFGEVAYGANADGGWIPQREVHFKQTCQKQVIHEGKTHE